MVRKQKGCHLRDAFIRAPRLHTVIDPFEMSVPVPWAEKYFVWAVPKCPSHCLRCRDTFCPTFKIGEPIIASRRVAAYLRRSEMSSAKNIPESPAAAAAPAVEKRVVLSMGGKGGVGKTSLMTGLAEWFQENGIPVKLLDLDSENKARGSLTHFFGGLVPKVNIHTPAGLDAFVDELTDGPPVILADMGAGAGQVTYEWFDKMYSDVTEAGLAFTAVGVVTADPASGESVLAWASRRGKRR